jgi:hypothetical protein
MDRFTTTAVLLGLALSCAALAASGYRGAALGLGLSIPPLALWLRGRLA